MKPIRFLSNSAQINNIVKGLTLSKSLFVSAILIGEPHTGKKTLVKTIFPKQRFISGKNIEELNKALDNSKEVIIYDFEMIDNIDTLNFENKRVIAIANKVKNSLEIERKFAFIYNMPPLREREEDIELLINYFIKDIKKELMIDGFVKFDYNNINLKDNIKSLKASVYKKLILNNLTKMEIEKILYDYLYRELDGNNGYREQLPLFEKPLIEAGLKKFKSQLRLSAVLGLNRNTLRKKIYELGID
jgi:DNA-binding protein Fis